MKTSRVKRCCSAQYATGPVAETATGGQESCYEFRRPAAERLAGSSPARTAIAGVYVQSPRIFACCVHTIGAGLLCSSAAQLFSSRCIGG